MKLALVVIGVVGAVVVVAIVLGQNSTSTSTVTPPADSLPPTGGVIEGGGSTRSSTRARPKLAKAGPFDSEPRDHKWAGAVEAKIRSRVKQLLNELPGDTIDVKTIECRSRRCRFDIAGRDEKLFGKFVEALQEKSGFHGFARQLTLKNLRRMNKRDGVAHVTVVLQFRR